MNERTSATRTGGSSGKLSAAESGAWGGGFVLGLIWIVLGVLCLGATGVASVAAVLWVGLLLAIAGVTGIVYGFRGGGGGVVLLGVLSLVVGILTAVHPGAGMVGLTVLAIGYFLIEGVFRIITSIADRYEGWGWDFAYGVCAIAIAIIAMRAWPLSSFWLLGILLGVDLIARGVATMAASIAARRVMHAVRQGHAT
jgi:uncharacterized membrane protein HdeD (DUF308 family)